MSLESVRCNECGAVLQVPSSARYVTCQHCNVPLVVQRTNVATYTEALPPPGVRGPAARESDPAWREMADRLERLEMQNELARIDREWDMERDRYMQYGRYGRRAVPNAAAGIVIGVVLCTLGLGMFGVGVAMMFFVAPALGFVFFLPGGILLTGGVLVGVVNHNAVKRYNRAYQDYQARRAAVLGEPPPGRYDED